jgi:hypothetical protein
MLDQGVSYAGPGSAPGLDKDVTVVVWGSSAGRRKSTPRRPRPLAQVSCAMLAGGGAKTGR